MTRPRPFDVVRLRKPVDPWPAGTICAVLDEYETVAGLEVVDPEDEHELLDCLISAPYEDLEIVWRDPSGIRTIRRSLGIIARHWRGLGVIGGPRGLFELVRDLVEGVRTRTLEGRLYAWAASVRAWSEPDFRAEVKVLRERAKTPAEDLISIEELARQVLGEERARQVFGEDPEWRAVKNDPRFRESLEQMRRGERGEWPEGYGLDEGDDE